MEEQVFNAGDTLVKLLCVDKTDQIYVLKFRIGITSLENVRNTARNISETLPPNAKLYAIPDEFSLEKLSISQLKTIRQHIDTLIDQYDGLVTRWRNR